MLVDLRKEQFRQLSDMPASPIEWYACKVEFHEKVSEEALFKERATKIPSFHILIHSLKLGIMCVKRIREEDKTYILYDVYNYGSSVNF